MRSDHLQGKAPYNKGTHMDILSVTGLIVAIGAIVLGQSLEGGHISSLVNIPAFIIVIGGTFGAILLQAPFTTFKHALRRSAWVFSPPQFSAAAAVNKVMRWSMVARAEGFLALENLIAKESDTFSAKALQLLVDGSEPDDIRYALELELSVREDLEYRAAQLFEGMGGYAPTIGIIGAVLGLIHVMENLADPNKLGAGIASAFVATLYGVAIANLVLLPVANKLKNLIRQQSQLNEIVMEGVIAIAQGDNPRNLEAKLKGFLHP